MIKGILKTATKSAINWLGGQFGVPEKYTEKVTDITDALFTKQSTGGDFRIIDTSLQSMPKFGGRMGYNASRMASGAKGYADVVNPETLYAMWDKRLSKYYSDKYKVARTVKGKVV